MYVIELDAARNRVIVGDDSDLDRDEFVVQRCNWIPYEIPPSSIEVTAKIRYNHPGTPATIYPGENGKARVKLHMPQRAITPGQACVFYQDELVVGGGWIDRYGGGRSNVSELAGFQSLPKQGFWQNIGFLTQYYSNNY